MRRLLLILLAVPLLAQQKPLPQMFGVIAEDPNVASPLTQQLNATATWEAFSFTANVSKQISEVEFFVTAVGGTLGANDLTCDLYSDTGSSTGKPNASIESRNTVTATPTGALWVNFTGFTATSTLVAGTRYWFVLKNANGTPATNFPTYNVPRTTSGFFPDSFSPLWGYAAKNTTDSGTTWSAGNANIACPFRIKYSDGTYDGLAYQTSQVANTIFGTNETGVSFVVPANVSIKVIGCAVAAFKTASPTGNLRCRIYSGSGGTPTLVATSTATPNAAIVNASQYYYYRMYFSSSHTFTAGTTVSLTLSDSAADSAGNCFKTNVFQLQNDTNTIAQLPWSLQLTATTDGTNFTQTAYEFMPFAVILDPAGEFASTGAGGATVTSYVQ